METRACPLCKNEGAHYEEVGDRNIDRNLWGKSWECEYCGHFVTHESVICEIEEDYDDQRHRITAAIRHHSSPDRPVSIMSDEELRRLVECVPSQVSIFEQLDRLLLVIADRTTMFGDKVPLLATDYPLVFARDNEELGRLAGALAELTRVEIPLAYHEVVLTLTGWERVEELRQSLPDSRRVFVAMSFRDDLTALYENGIKLGVEDSRYFQAFRVDSEQHNQKIDDKIVADIRRSALVVADVTHQSQGVYYEAGYAAGLGRQVIWMCRENEIKKAHFDTRQFNHILWNTPEEAREKLNDRIVATVLPADAVMGSR